MRFSYLSHAVLGFTGRSISRVSRRSIHGEADPCREIEGKIVIQAKRFTDTVGVSGARDLYGAVVDEGATKGIFVTISAFGSESYAFAKDEPLTRAHIDLAEAKRVNVAPLARSGVN